MVLKRLKFCSRKITHGQVAQSVEQWTENPRVGSSILSLATTNEEKEKKELLQKAPEAHHTGKLDVADDIYIMILENDKLDFDANHLHGAVLSQNKKYAEAIKFFAVAYENSKPTCELLNNDA